MFKNNIYNIDREFDYATIEAFVVKSLEKILKLESLRKTSARRNNDVISDYKDDVNKLPVPPTSPLLKLKIRNTTSWQW
jgi:hypothetical protein